MIDEVDILHESHCSDFSGDVCEEATSLLCIIVHHHCVVIELGENRFNSLSETLVCPGRKSPVFLVKPIRNLKGKH